MRCLIFTGPNNYNIESMYHPRENDFIVGADQGALYLAEHKLDFDLAIGDFDSVDQTMISTINEFAKEIKIFPVKKDYTDTYLAVQEAMKRGYDEIIIYGGIGKRFDHSYANMHLLKLGNITIVTDNEIMYMLNPGTYDIENNYKYISFFAIEDVKGLCLKGFLFDLEQVELIVGDPLCISNQQEGTISFDSGVILVIHQNE